MWPMAVSPGSSRTFFSWMASATRPARPKRGPPPRRAGQAAGGGVADVADGGLARELADVLLLDGLGDQSRLPEAVAAPGGGVERRHPAAPPAPGLWRRGPRVRADC